MLCWSSRQSPVNAGMLPFWLWRPALQVPSPQHDLALVPMRGTEVGEQQLGCQARVNVTHVESQTDRFEHIEVDVDVLSAEEGSIPQQDGHGIFNSKAHVPSWVNSCKCSS